MKTIKISHNKATKRMRQSESFSRFNDKKIRENDHLDQIRDLMFNADKALRLQIDNLVLTYGIQALRKSVDATNLNVVKKFKKAA